MPGVNQTPAAQATDFVLLVMNNRGVKFNPQRQGETRSGRFSGGRTKGTRGPDAHDIPGITRLSWREQVEPPHPWPNFRSYNRCSDGRERISSASDWDEWTVISDCSLNTSFNSK